MSYLASWFSASSLWRQRINKGAELKALTFGVGLQGRGRNVRLILSDKMDTTVVGEVCTECMSLLNPHSKFQGFDLVLPLVRAG
jgi:hypothetical protein